MISLIPVIGDTGSGALLNSILPTYPLERTIQ